MTGTCAIGSGWRNSSISRDRLVSIICCSYVIPLDFCQLSRSDMALTISSRSGQSTGQPALPHLLNLAAPETLIQHRHQPVFQRSAGYTSTSWIWRGTAAPQSAPGAAGRAQQQIDAAEDFRPAERSGNSGNVKFFVSGQRHHPRLPLEEITRDSRVARAALGCTRFPACTSPSALENLSRPRANRALCDGFRQTAAKSRTIPATSI